MPARYARLYGTLGAQTLGRACLAVPAWVLGRPDLVQDQQRAWGEALTAAAGIELKVEGREHARPGRPYVVVCNHASALDPVLLFAGLPFGATYVAKRELLDVPVFGWIIGRTGAVFVDRGNTAAARASLREAARRVRAGQNVIVFPEGTRSWDGRLEPFKKGGFILAIEAGVDVLPVTLVDAWRRLPRGELRPRPGPVTLRIHPPVPTRGLGYGDRNRLIATVRAAIASGLEVAPPSPPAVG